VNVARGSSPSGNASRDAGSPGERVGVVVPALDEAENLPGLIGDLRARGLHRIVIVDNGSTDDTAGVARGAGAEVVHEPRRGYGRACLSGIERLHDDPPEVVLFVDADRSDDPEALEEIWRPVLEGSADLAIGIRRGAADAPARQRAGTRAVTLAARFVHGVSLSDLGPLRAISWPLLATLGMDDRDWGWTLQMQLRAHRSGARLLEVPVRRRPRAAGRSKISGSLHMSIYVGMRMFRTVWRERGWTPRGAGSVPEGGGGGERQVDADRNRRTASSDAPGASSGGR
jgi:glycosyltransferase involved in cell wall biosynthesis